MNLRTHVILYKPISGYDGFELFQTKGNELLAGGQSGVEGTIITTFAIVILIFVKQHFIKQRKED